MATEDKRIDQLDPVSVLDLTSLMAMQQGTNAKKVTLQQLLDYLNGQIDTGNAVLFVSQELSDDQKHQARSNIRVGSMGRVASNCVASGEYSSAEGYGSVARGIDAHAEGSESKATGDAAHSEGISTEASANGAHAEGVRTKAAGDSSHSEGYETNASSEFAHVEGYKSEAKHQAAHAEGVQCVASGQGSHAEGSGSKAGNLGAHAEGSGTAHGAFSHAEGSSSYSVGRGAHAEGNSTAVGDFSHSENQAKANGVNSHAEGKGTVANGEAQHVQGRYNKEDNDNRYAHIVGNGSYGVVEGTDGEQIPFEDYSNAHTLDWAGVPWFAGDRVMLGGTGMDDEAAVELMPVFVPQEWTEEQKLQARTNIGAMAKGDTEVKVSSKAYLNSYKIVVTVNGVESEGPAMSLVRYDVNQTGLTEEQKAQARANIGVDAYIEQVFLGGEW